MGDFLSFVWSFKHLKLHTNDRVGPLDYEGRSQTASFVACQYGMKHFCAPHNITSRLSCTLPAIRMVGPVIAFTLSFCAIYDSTDSPLAHATNGVIGVQAEKMFIAQLFRMPLL